jgi:hypothetical protein|tara:strand:- start:2465 stop:2950 length:486 start_codon:yes stop_codon:yes gene_type:complete
MAGTIDFLITYRVVKMLVTPWKKTDAFKFGIIDDKGNVLKTQKQVRNGKSVKEKKAYTVLHRFVFNLKRILQKVGLGSRLGSFGVALALLIKEDQKFAQHQQLIEKTVVSYLKENNMYEELLEESRTIPEIDKEPVGTYFGVDVFEQNGELVSEYEYAKAL